MYEPARITEFADFEFKFNMPMSINRTLVGIPYEQFREIFSITIIPGIGQ